jgi:hypothetical protein
MELAIGKARYNQFICCQDIDINIINNKPAIGLAAKQGQYINL